MCYYVQLPLDCLKKFELYGVFQKKCAVYRSLTLSGHKSVSFQVKAKLRQFSNTSGQVESETVFKFLSNAAVYQVIKVQIELW